MIALDLASLPGNRWKADLHDPRLREEADFYLSVRSSLPAHQVLHQLPLVCKIGAPDDVTLLINVALNGVPLVPLYLSSGSAATAAGEPVFCAGYAQ